VPEAIEYRPSGNIALLYRMAHLGATILIAKSLLTKCTPVLTNRLHERGLPYVCEFRWRTGLTVPVSSVQSVVKSLRVPMKHARGGSFSN
jgi:hypothetical protein